MKIVSREKLLYGLYKVFGKFNIVNRTTLILYKNFLFPLIKRYLKHKYPNILKIHYRNSITTPEHFNAFLSDLDVTIIIKEESDFISPISTYLKLKSYLIMLDSPQVYTEKEFEHLQTFKKPHLYPLLEFTFNFRKIKWSTDSLILAPYGLNKIKQLKSIKKSFSKILITEALKDDNIFNIEDFSALKDLIASDNSTKNICFWSNFLETSRPGRLQLLMTTKQYFYFNALMPGETISTSIKDSISLEFIENKIALEYYELYLSKSSFRLSSAQNHDVIALTEWITYLEYKLRVGI